MNKQTTALETIINNINLKFGQAESKYDKKLETSSQVIENKLIQKIANLRYEFYSKLNEREDNEKIFEKINKKTTTQILRN